MFSVITDEERMEKTFLKDYQKPHYQILKLDLEFSLFDNYVTVAQKSRYQLDEIKPFFLNGLDQEILELTFTDKNQSLEFKVEKKNDGLTVFPTVKEFNLNIKTKINPYTNKSLEGLYGSKAFLVTQCEAEGFRKITFFPDRPDVMTMYTVTIEADVKKFPILLSNGNRIEKKSVGDNRHRVTWQDPWKKPCYLFAVFAGDVDVLTDTYTTRSGKKVNLEIYAEKGKSPRCKHAMESLKLSMKWDEDKFDREYDLSEYMIVAIDDFNAGAMENKGLNIFNSKLILADSQTATDADFFDIESVVAHEYFHNWTGNRITLRNWFQLSLKEGLTVFRDQEFSADMTEKGIQRVRDVDTLKNRQFPEDAGPNAHPVRPESCYSVDNFFTPTIYEKGAEVIRMMQNILGKKQFKLAMDRYFKKYDGQAITTDDYRTTILDESGYNSELFVNWYQKPGTPKVSVTDSWDATSKSFTLHLEQIESQFEIPIFVELFDRDGKKLDLKSDQVQTNSDGQKLILLKTSTLEVKWDGLSGRPVVSFLRNFSAPIIVSWNRPLDDYYFLALNDDDTFNRNESLQQYWLNSFKNLYTQFILENKKDAVSKLQPLNGLLESILKNEKLEERVKAKLFSFPSHSVIMQFMGFLDAAGFQKTEMTMKSYFGKNLGSTLKEKVLQLNTQLTQLEAKSDHYDQNIAAKRELKMNLTDLLESVEGQTNPYQTKNFTSVLFQFASQLKVLAGEARKQEILKFYTQWKSEPLVLNKWLQTISTSDHPETFETIKWVCSQGYFNPENPNQVYALLRNFGNNLFYFHQNNSHYDFFLGKLAEIDAFNPQVAARLATTLQVVGSLPEEKKSYLGKLIQQMTTSNKLSKNSFEVLSKLA
ncbi:MAG: aminopeptidase N [Bdellovibrio sp. 28-41-41]|nr:MAG: aminopeptidase N [Bdellovibrio sp. 28-41-41]